MIDIQDLRKTFRTSGMERETSGRENLQLQARLYGMNKSAATRR